MTAPRHILPAIALSQLAATSLWFAINAVMPDLQRDAALPASAVGWLTAAVQLGFIGGTLVFALLAVADRFSPRLVFLACALLGAALAWLTAWLPPDQLRAGAARRIRRRARNRVEPTGSG